MNNPYIKPKYNSTNSVMFDVIIALLPLLCFAYFAYGMQAMLVILIAISTAAVTDFIFSYFYVKNWKAIFDGSAIITALLLSFTLSPITPLYVVAFGSFCAIVFGKILWGGLGKNRFNPALVGREFMTAFFPIMASGTIWATKAFVNVSELNLFSNEDYLSNYVSGLLYKPTGAIGEYSILMIALGGLYLLIKRRISWHIPFALLAVFSLGFWFVEDGDDLKYSIAGILLGSLFMATDMPSSPNSPNGKLFYGSMIGLASFIFILSGIRFEYLSFSILILNGFSPKINDVFTPTAWGKSTDWQSKIEKIFMLLLSVSAVVLSVISLHYYGMTHYLVYLYLVYIIFKFNFSFFKKISNPI